MECGACTLCCELFPVKWLNKPANTMCKYICDQGCKIHDTKPAECSDFNCMYAQADNVPIELRPDRSGIVFEKISRRIIYGTVNHNAKPSEFTKGQIQNFVKQGFSVVLASLKEVDNKFFIAKKHIEEKIRKEFAQHLLKEYGNVRN